MVRARDRVWVRGYHIGEDASVMSDSYNGGRRAVREVIPKAERDDSRLVAGLRQQSLPPQSPEDSDHQHQSHIARTHPGPPKIRSECKAASYQAKMGVRSG